MANVREDTTASLKVIIECQLQRIVFVFPYKLRGSACFLGGKAMGGYEGGIRVPTIFRWPGVIPPNTEISTATSQMDFLPTIAAAVGADVPSDRLLDGVDILPMLTGKNTQLIPHEFMFHYCGTEMHAVRWTESSRKFSVSYFTLPARQSNCLFSDKIWKVHYETPQWLEGTQGCGFACSCFGDHVIVQDPPLLFNIVTDPGENRPCTKSDPCADENYDDVIAHVNRAAAEFKSTLTEVENQYTWNKYVTRPWIQPCCNFPYCSCSEET